MILKRDIVDRAFKLLSMSGFELDDSPEDSHDILQTLDDMMAELQGEDYNFGYRVPADPTDSVLNDDSGITRDALTGIAHKLALRICSLYGKTPPALLAVQAERSYNALLTRYCSIPAAMPHSHANPADNWLFGAGNKRGY